MKKLIAILMLVIISTASCHININKKVTGNGKMSSENRHAGNLSKIKIRGGVNVEVIPGSASLKVEADENLLRYIETREEDGWLVIKTKDNYSLRSDNPIRVVVTADVIKAVNIAGSGHVKGQGKFSGADNLNIKIAGSGDVMLEVNTPKVNVDISGSGSVILSGETKNANIDIAGSGDYQAEDLLTENTEIDIKGSGDAKVYADNLLDADVLGSGTVYYKGKANVRSRTTGSGKVKPMQ